MSAPPAPPDFSSLSEVSSRALRLAIEGLESCPPPVARQLTFSAEDLISGAAVQFAKTHLADVKKGQSALYRFSLPHDADPQETQIAFDHRSATAFGRAFARSNGTQSHVLYVGRSYDLRKRTVEHLGFGARQTFALNLAHWAPVLDLPIQFDFAIYDPCVTSETLGHLEDALWDASRPMFGRRGSR